MKIPLAWLSTFVQHGLEPETLSHQLTMAGLEVEENTPVAPPFSHTIVAKIIEVAPHPDADRLHICQVDINQTNPVQIVCGAPNVSMGAKVACALPGAVLPNDFKIKAAKIRQVDSAGMLCAAKELGISESDEGLLLLPEDAPVGENLRTYLNLDEQCLTLKLTPNRADCLSLLGLAREVAALTQGALDSPQIQAAPVHIDATRKINLSAPEACPLYCGRIIRGVNASTPTPIWMQQRLERCGVRPVSVLVDITNYVLLELGQPLHAFDNTKLEGAINVRYAKPQEALTLLNGQSVSLPSDILVIADDHQALALAGIMGGENSAVTLETTEIFLESAFFSPKIIAGKARRYGLDSEASHRFERGVDFMGVHRALERATNLVLEICGGEVAPINEACISSALPKRPAIQLDIERVNKILGIDISSEQAQTFLERLELKVKLFDSPSKVLEAIPPSWRFDLEIAEDLIEEIARLYGYENIPQTEYRPVRAPVIMQPQHETRRSINQIKHALAGLNYQEVINLAFVAPQWEQDFSQVIAANPSGPIHLANPIISQFSQMRSTLIGGLINTLRNNIRRKHSVIRLFETGRCFYHEAENPDSQIKGIVQPWKIAALAWGLSTHEQWGEEKRLVDFFDFKGDLERCLSGSLAASFICTPIKNHPALHPGRSALVSVDGKQIGYIGALHPQWVEEYELTQAPVVFELDLESITSTPLPRYTEVSNLPESIRDIAVLLDDEIPIHDVIFNMNKNKPKIVKEIKLFDIYRGKGIPKGKKSVALRMVMQDTERTLRDDEVEAATADLTTYLHQTFNTELRL